MIDQDATPPLNTIAPEVDESAAADLFRRRRGRRRSRRRVGLASLALLLVAGVAVLLSQAGSNEGIAVVAGPDSTSEVAPPTSAQSTSTTPGEIPFEVIAQPEANSSQVGIKPIAAAVPWELHYLWTRLGEDPGSAPTVDLERDFLLAITVPGNGCRSTLERLQLSAGEPLDELTALTEPGSGRCPLPEVALWTTVVAIDRSLVPDEFRLVVPTDPQFGYDHAGLLVRLGSVDRELPGEPFDTYPVPGALLNVVGVSSDDTLKVRSGPGPEFDVVAQLPPLSSAFATGRNRLVESGVWAEIEGAVGWSNTRFLTHLAPFRDISAEVGTGEGDLPSATSLRGVAQAVVDRLYPSLDSGVVPELTVVDETTVNGESVITVDLTGAGDDSAGGTRLLIRATSRGDMFDVDSVEAAAHCTRGLRDDGLCL